MLPSRLFFRFNFTMCRIIATYLYMYISSQTINAALEACRPSNIGRTIQTMLHLCGPVFRTVLLPLHSTALLLLAYQLKCYTYVHSLMLLFIGSIIFGANYPFACVAFHAAFHRYYIQLLRCAVLIWTYAGVLTPPGRNGIIINSTQHFRTSKNWDKHNVDWLKKKKF